MGPDSLIDNPLGIPRFNQSETCSKDELIKAVWPTTAVTDESLTQCISEIRAALDDRDQTIIKTVPRRGYLFASAITQQLTAEPPRGASTIGEIGSPLPDRPSIAVLPFLNLSGDPAQEYFCDGVTEDIITELSRFRELFVIARNSSFKYRNQAIDVRDIGRDLGVRYILEGSVRRDGERIRVTAQLIDAMTGVHRWAERYDRKLSDVFAMQDNVVEAIVPLLAAHVHEAEKERARLRPPTNWQAYDYYMLAAHSFSKHRASLDPEELYEARRLLQQALSIDPNYARAYAALAAIQLTSWFNAFDADFLASEALERAYEFVRKAIQLDSNLPEAHAEAGLVLAWRREHDASIAAFETAFALNPNYLNWHFITALVFAGEFGKAVDVANAYMRFDPFYPSFVLGWLGLAHYMRKDYAAALPLLREQAVRIPNLRGGRIWLAATYAKMGELDEARSQAAEVLRILPGYTIDGVGRRFIFFRRPEDTEHFFDGVRLAGLPEY